MRQRRRLAAFILLGLAQAVAAPATGWSEGFAAKPGLDSAVVDYGQPGQLVTLADGRRINLRCTGAGKTTVILDAGGGNFSLAWYKVQGEVARFTRVCAYDRARC